MKINVLSIDGKKLKEIELPEYFSYKIKEDLVAKVLETQKRKQPYAPSPVAGKQSSVSGKIVHKRKVWKSGYGRGTSRIPKKTMSRRGSQFNWIGAEIPSARGGRRAHPPTTISMVKTKKINKKEREIALKSSLSATANGKIISRRYKSLKDEKLVNFPLIVESKIALLKTKPLINSLKKILGENLFKLSLKRKKIRGGKGKLRGRKYKSNLGLLLVIGKNEKLKTNAFDVVNSGNLGVKDLANGGIGRITLYTEQSIKELNEKFGGRK